MKFKLYIISLAVFFISCRETIIEDKVLSIKFEEISNHKRNNKTLEFRFTSITDYNWDELYIFKPYTQISQIEMIVGGEYKELNDSQINHTETFNLLVFKKQNEVIRYSRVPRNVFDFEDSVPQMSPFHEKSIFRIKKTQFGKQDWLFLEPI